MVVVDRQDLTTYRPILLLSPALDEPGLPAISPGGFLASGLRHWRQDHEKRWHLMLDAIRQDRKHPRAPNNR
jgi:hypothetical protein